MISQPITRKDANNLAYSGDCHLLGSILYRLVYAGAKQEASQILDSLSQPLEQYMTHEKMLHMGYVEKLGFDWLKTREHWYDTL